jgi:hypothetical protein
MQQHLFRCTSCLQKNFLKSAFNDFRACATWCISSNWNYVLLHRTIHAVDLYLHDNLRSSKTLIALRSSCKWTWACFKLSWPQRCHAAGTAATLWSDWVDLITKLAYTDTAKSHQNVLGNKATATATDDGCWTQWFKNTPEWLRSCIRDGAENTLKEDSLVVIN